MVLARSVFTGLFVVAFFFPLTFLIFGVLGQTLDFFVYSNLKFYLVRVRLGGAGLF